VNLRDTVEWELRARISPELAAAGLVIIMAFTLLVIFNAVQAAGANPAPGPSDARPSSFVREYGTTSAGTVAVQSAFGAAGSMVSRPRESDGHQLRVCARDAADIVVACAG
jgi:hypothetical protein